MLDIITDELKNSFEYIEHIFHDIIAEFPNINITIESNQRFFNALANVNVAYMPTSQNLTMVSYNDFTQKINIGGVLSNKYHHLVKRISKLTRVAHATHLNSIDIQCLLMMQDIDNRQSCIASVDPQILQNSHNSAAVYGSDFDIVFDELVKIKEKLGLQWVESGSTFK